MVSISEQTKVLFWSSIVAVGALLVTILIDGFIQPIETIDAQSMLETIIRLDGILFGFTAVMVGLLIGRSERVSEKVFYSSILFALISFWSYILSILMAFIRIYYGKSAFAPVLMTLFGAAHSSLYMVLGAFEEKLGVKKQK